MIVWAVVSAAFIRKNHFVRNMHQNHAPLHLRLNGTNLPHATTISQYDYKCPRSVLDVGQQFY